MQTYSLSEARKRFCELVEAAQKEGAEFTVTVNGTSAATLISAEDYAQLMETIEILQDQQALADIAASEKEYKQGKFIALSKLK